MTSLSMVCYRAAIKRRCWGHDVMNWAKLILVGVAASLATQPAAAQTLGRDDFVAAVRERDGTKAMEMLRERGKLALNSRDDKGMTGLIIAISRRDDDWTSFLLDQGADPNLAARNGETPLIAAARSGYLGAAADLIRAKVKVDTTNGQGETALIVAVQQRQTAIVKLLLAAGADPDRSDSAAGYSARDYAKRDTRSREMLKLIEAKKPKA